MLRIDANRAMGSRARARFRPAEARVRDSASSRRGERAMERVRVARTGVSESEGRPGVERRRCRVSRRRDRTADRSSRRRARRLNCKIRRWIDAISPFAPRSRGFASTALGVLSVRRRRLGSALSRDHARPARASRRASAVVLGVIGAPQRRRRVSPEHRVADASVRRARLWRRRNRRRLLLRRDRRRRAAGRAAQRVSVGKNL